MRSGAGRISTDFLNTPVLKLRCLFREAKIQGLAHPGLQAQCHSRQALTVLKRTQPIVGSPRRSVVQARLSTSDSIPGRGCLGKESRNAGACGRWRSACSWLMRCASRATEHRPCVMRCRQDLLGRRSVWCGWQGLRRWREQRGNCGDEHGHEHNFTHFSVAALSRRIDYGGIRGVALCPPPAFDSLSSTHNAAPRGLYTGPLGGQPHG